MQITGTSDASGVVTVSATATTRASGASVDRSTTTEPTRTPREAVRFVALVEDLGPDTWEPTRPLDALPPHGTIAERAARAMQQFANRMLDPLDEFVDGTPGMAHLPAPHPAEPVANALGDGLLA